MRFKAILAEEARKRYPLSILLMVVGVLIIPFLDRKVRTILGEGGFRRCPPALDPIGIVGPVRLRVCRRG